MLCSRSLFGLFPLCLPLLWASVLVYFPPLSETLTFRGLPSQMRCCPRTAAVVEVPTVTCGHPRSLAGAAPSITGTHVARSVRRPKVHRQLHAHMLAQRAAHLGPRWWGESAPEEEKGHRTGQRTQWADFILFLSNCTVKIFEIIHGHIGEGNYANDVHFTDFAFNFLKNCKWIFHENVHDYREGLSEQGSSENRVLPVWDLVQGQFKYWEKTNIMYFLLTLSSAFSKSIQ